MTRLVDKINKTSKKIRVAEPYMRFCKGNGTHALVLAQLVFWSSKKKPGEYFYKSNREISEELFIKEDQARYAVNQIEKLLGDIIQVKVRRAGKTPQRHYLIDELRLEAVLCPSPTKFVEEEQPTLEPEELPSEETHICEDSSLEELPNENSPTWEAPQMGESPIEDIPKCEGSHMEEFPFEEIPNCEYSQMEKLPSENIPDSELGKFPNHMNWENSQIINRSEPDHDHTDTNIPAPSKMLDAEPEHDEIMFWIPLKKKNEQHGVTRSQISELRDAYPAVNIEQEVRNMIGWCNTNPTKKKTKTGVGRFIHGWLCRVQDRAYGGLPARGPDFHNGDTSWAEGLELGGYQ